METSFGTRLAQRMDALGPVCAGIDPHPQLLEAWGLPDSPDGLRLFAEKTLEAIGDHVCAVKPQAAFFERHGWQGMSAFADTVSWATEAGTLVIGDLKRGDIGSTMSAYAHAYLHPSRPEACDAITISPYLGPESLEPVFTLADQFGKGSFTLALTSNPGAGALQTVGGEHCPARQVLAQVAERNAKASAASSAQSQRSSGRLGSHGVVIGATAGQALAAVGFDLSTLGGPILAPGIGAQGAGRAELEDVFAGASHLVLASASRSILRGGPSPRGLRAALAATVEECAAALGR